MGTPEQERKLNKKKIFPPYGHTPLLNIFCGAIFTVQFNSKL